MKAPKKRGRARYLPKWATDEQVRNIQTLAREGTYTYWWMSRDGRSGGSNEMPDTDACGSMASL